MDALGTRQSARPDRLDPLTEDPLLRALFPALAVGVEWGLERTARALSELGNPHHKWRAIHVGGTNGKGSVTTTLASVIGRSGRRVGCYTSPHLCSFVERIQVDGRAVDEARLLRYAEGVRETITRCGLTFFEAATVLAFHVFAREGVEFAAVEVGLGGRLDATNVLRPDVSVVTNVAMDHMEYLGNTLEAIAIEKAGIAKRGVPFVTGEADPTVVATLSRCAREVAAPVHVVGAERVRDVVVMAEGTRFRMSTENWGEIEALTPLAGIHQAMNMAVAIEALDHLPEELRPHAAELLEGVRGVRHPGRNEIRAIGGRTWIFDVAHNPAGIASLVDTLDRLDLPRPRVALVGVLADKDWGAMLTALRTRVDEMVLTVPVSAPADRRWDPGVAVAALGSERSVTAMEDFGEALARAASRAGEGTVVVTGSVHTVGNAMRLLSLDPLG